MYKRIYHIFVWCLVLPLAISAQEAADDFQRSFTAGEWEAAAKAAEGNADQLMLIHWRRGQLDEIAKLINNSPAMALVEADRIRLTVLKEGPVKAMALADTVLAKAPNKSGIAVEALAAAVLAGDVKASGRYFALIGKPADLANRSLERLAEVQPEVGRMLGKPELTRQAAIDLTEIGMTKFDWNPRYKVLRALYYYRAGQRIDASDWAKEMIAEGAQDPYFTLMPAEAKLKLLDPNSVSLNIRILVTHVEQQLAGIETFTGVKRLDQISTYLVPLEKNAPGHPVTVAAAGALAYAKGAAVKYPDELKAITVRCGLYWHYLAQVTGDAFDRAAALPWGRKAIKAEPWNVDMMVAHAINCHREGEPAEAIKALDTAHTLEPRLSQVWNLRTLIRSVIKNFHHHKSSNYDIRMRRDEWAPFKDLFLPRIDEEYALLTKRYGDKPDKLHFILYTDKQDFDVSVFMVPSAPAIGACMGRLVTMPSPSYLQYKTEPWAPVLRHEMAHAWHIHLSKGRVTRWFTEGLAHYEEVVRRPEWDWEEGYDQTLVDLVATNKLANFGKLNDGFNGDNVRFYYQYCRWVMEWLDKEHGWESVVKCLKAYGEGVSDTALFNEIIGLDNEDAEKQFRAWLKNNVLDRIPYPARIEGPPTTVSGLAWAYSEGRFVQIATATVNESDPMMLLWRARALEELDGGDAALAIYRQLEKKLKGDFLFHYSYGRNLVDSGDWNAAIPHLEQAIKIYPNRVKSHDNPWYFLYQCHKALKDEAAAIDTIWRYTRIQQKDHRSRFWLTRRYLGKGDWRKVRQLLVELSEIHPFNFEVLIWQAAQARRQQNSAVEKMCYARMFQIARLEELVDQETLLSDRERLDFLKQAIRPWLEITKGAERQNTARIIEQFFPDNRDVKEVLIEP